MVTTMNTTEWNAAALSLPLQLLLLLILLLLRLTLSTNIDIFRRNINKYVRMAKEIIDEWRLKEAMTKIIQTSVGIIPRTLFKCLAILKSCIVDACGVTRQLLLQ
jgi:hypothetical protein